MHANSYRRMKAFVDHYVAFRAELAETPIRVLDIADMNASGGYRPLFDGLNVEYIGADINPGPNVDLVLPDSASWDAVPENSLDVVISGQCFAHADYPWELMRLIGLKLKPAGVGCVISPSQWPVHRNPRDCYRFLPEGLLALARWGGLEVLELHHDEFRETPESEPVGDSIIVFTKASPDAFRPPGDDVPRHLIYYIYPRKNSNWRWNVGMLRPRLDLFDGVRRVYISIDDTTDTPDMVQQEFGDARLEFVVGNNLSTGETIPFITQLLPAVRELPGYTFYAHAKGVTYTEDDPRYPHVMNWTERMLDLNVRPDASRYLDSYDAVGVFRRKLSIHGTPWFYPGTFFWLRNESMFSGDWHRIHKNKRGGVEAYIGRHVPYERAYCLFADDLPLHLHWQTY